MSNYTIAADVRKTTGKGAARKLRREGRIPAVLYGRKNEPIMLAVDTVSLERLLRQGAGESSLIDIQVQRENNADRHTVILKELQIDPVKQFFRHADFHEIAMDEEITLEIPIELTGTPAGVEEGGILENIRRYLTVSCLPDKLVDKISVDVSDMGIGDSLHIKDIPLPSGLTVQEEEDLAVATIAAPSIEAEPEAEEAEEEHEGEDTGDESAED
ncbi:MAG: 50S ribosomal protein L25/general stress protein Ctc [Desulfatiglandaceae bacterium]